MKEDGMAWTYEYRDKPRPCYRIQDGSDDGDVAECWDEDVAQAIVEVMNVRCRWHSTERTPCSVCHPVSSETTARAGDLTRLREWVAEVRYVDPSLAARIDAKLMVTERCSECRYVGLLDGHLPPSNTCPNTGKVAKRERV